MGKLKDYFEKVQNQKEEHSRMKSPSPLDRNDFLSYRREGRKVERLTGFFRSKVFGNDLSLEQVENATINAIGKEEYENFFKDVINGPDFKQGLFQIFSENHPDRVKELREQGIKVDVRQPDFVDLMSKELSREEYDRTLTKLIYLKWANLNQLKCVDELEKLLTPQQLSNINSRIDNYKDVTEMPEEERLKPRYADRVNELKNNIPRDIIDNKEKYEKLINALDYANTHLTIVDEEYKNEWKGYEADIQRIGTDYTEKEVSENIDTYMDGEFNNLYSKIPIGTADNYIAISPDKKTAAQDLYQDGSVIVSKQTEEALRKIFKKFDEMEMLRPGEEKLANAEDGLKIYGQRRLQDRKNEFADALMSGDYDRIIAAQSSLEKTWKDMEELYQIAKENFSQDRTLFPGNVDGTRNSDLSWEFVGDIMTTAQINTCFVAYNTCKLANVSIDEYLKNPMKVAMRPSNDAFEKNNLNAITSGKSFDECMNILAAPDEHHLNFDIAVAPTGCGTRRAVEMSYLLEVDPDLRMGNNIVVSTVVEMFPLMVENEENKMKIFTLRNLTPEGQKYRRQAIQNLITVADDDRRVGDLIGDSSANFDGTVETRFKIEDYVKSHDIDYVGMMLRTQKMISALANVPNAPSAFEIRGEAYMSYLRVLDAKKSDKGKNPDYDMLSREADRIYKELSASPDCPESVKDGMEKARGRYHVAMREYLSQLRGGADNLQGDGARLYGEFLDSVEELVNRSDELSAAGADGRAPQLDGNAIDSLIMTYQNTIISAQNYRQSAPQGAQLDEARKEIIGHVQDLLGADLVALNAAKNAGVTTTFPEIIDNARIRTVDLGDRKLEKAGAYMSSRIRMTIPGPDGKPMEGFFTETSSCQKPEEEYAEFAGKMKEKHPDIAEFIDRMEANEEFINDFNDVNYGAYMNIINQYHDMVNVEDRMSFFNSIQNTVGYSDAELSSMASTERSEAIAEYLQGRAMIANKQAAFSRHAGIQPGDNIDKRNSAMTAVANLLNMGDVIAPSVSLKVKVGDKTMSGTFMAFAKGADVNNVGGVLSEADLAKMEKQSPIGQISNLNVLDYLCGNMDRHPANMFYDLDKETGRLKGIQGIDNDLSFGRKKASGLSTVSLSDIPVMSQKTADIVMNLDVNVLKTVLRQYDLPEESLDRVGERLSELQGAIVKSREYFKENRVYGKTVKGYIRICSEDELAKMTLDDVVNPHDRFGFAMGDKIKGAFSKVRSLPSTAISNEIEAKDKEMRSLKDAAFSQSNGLLEASNALEEGKKNTWFGTKEYDNMAREIQELIKLRNETFTGELNAQKLDTLKKSYAENEARVKTYLDRKAKEKKPSEASSRRQAAAKKTLENLQESMKNLNSMSDNLKEKKNLEQDAQIISDRETIEQLNEGRIRQEEAFKHKMEEREAAVDKMHGPMRMLGETSLKAYQLMRDFSMGSGEIKEEQVSQIKNAIASTVLCTIVEKERESNPNGPHPIEDSLNTSEKFKAATQRIAKSQEFEKLLAGHNKEEFSRSMVNDYLMNSSRNNFFASEISKHMKKANPNLENAGPKAGNNGPEKNEVNQKTVNKSTMKR